MSVETDYIPRLIGFAEDALGQLRLPNGLYCHDFDVDSSVVRGESVRYSIMVLLGLLRRTANGAEPSVAIDGLYSVIRTRWADLGVGDLGLLLWAEARMGAAAAGETLATLERLSSDVEKLKPLEGMEAAWFVLGAAEAVSAGLPAEAVAQRAIDNLQSRKSPKSPLYRHTGLDRGRALLPNFATEIYTLLALSEVARRNLAEAALADATQLAESLISLRLDDGGWPWLFHADRAVVAERYEVYSVHQSAMAPMALFALTEVSGDDRYATAAVESYQWCLGRNELGLETFDMDNLLVYRSIRRQGRAQRANLATNAVLASVGLPVRTDIGGVAVERTFRPYHLGWILEAWAGREPLYTPLDAVVTSQAVGDRRIHLFGVDIDALSMEETLDKAFELASGEKVSQHVVLNAGKVVLMSKDERLRQIIASCDLVNADGASVVWASRILNTPLPERVAGIDLFLRIVERAAHSGESVYFLGATDEVLATMLEVFRERYPTLQIAGFRNGYWDDDRRVIDEVRAAEPAFLFLAIPSPRKEFWLHEHLTELAVPFVMGVGGSFDVVAGKVRRAPGWAQRAGFEWLYRLMQEPRRMWKRYLYGNSAFLVLTFKEWRRAR